MAWHVAAQIFSEASSFTVYKGLTKINFINTRLDTTDF